MIDKFLEWIDGTYENKEQALIYPTKYKYVRLTHCVLPNGFIYGEQKNFFADRVYRQFLVEPVLVNNQVVVKNYEIERERYLGFNNLNDFLIKSFPYKNGCDTIFDFVGDKFAGNIRGCECIVDWKGEETYVKNSAILTENSYKVYDKGFSTKTHKRIWGSAYKHYDFKKIDKGYLWSGG